MASHLLQILDNFNWFHSYKINTFKPNGFSHSLQLDQDISVLMVVGWYFSFLFKI